MPGSGVTLPLDLKHIASRCVGSYFAPKRFAAVQLAFATPRCRVLVFRKFTPCSPAEPPFTYRSPTVHLPVHLPFTSQCTRPAR